MEIPTLPPASITPITRVTPSTLGKHTFGFSLVSTAHANPPATIHLASRFNLGVAQVQTNYVVVLDQATSLQDAKSKAAVLQQKTSVKIVKSNNTYLIVTASGKQNRTNALNEAVQLKSQRGLRPSLQEIR